MSKDNVDNAHEKKMEQVNASVVIFHNISDEDFIHAWGGRDYIVRAGEKLPLGYPVADILSKHLAMKILREKAHKEGKTGDKINLYTPKAIEELVAKIMTEVIAQPIVGELSEEDREQMKAKRFKTEFKDKVTPKTVEVDKKEVIKELKKRKVKFNPRDSKEVLLQLLVDSEKNDE